MRALLLTIGLAGCSGGELVTLGFPELSGARSALLGVVEASAVTVTASDVFDGAALVLERPSNPLDARLELLLLDDELSAYGLAPGPIRAAPAGSTSFRLPSARGVFSADVTAGAAGAWTPQGSPSASMIEFRATVGAPSRCRTLSIRNVPHPSGPDYAFALDNEGEAIMFGNNRSMLLLKGNAMTDLTLVGMSDFDPRAGGKRPGADPFFVSEDGRIAYGLVDDASVRLTLATTATVAPLARFIDAGLQESGFEFFTFSRSGMLSRVSPTVNIHELLADPTEPSTEFGGLVRLRSGSAVFGLASTKRVLFYEMPERTRAIDSGVSSVASILGVPGVLVGTVNGELLIERASGFEPLFSTRFAFPLSAMAPFGAEGVMYASVGGQIGYYSPATGPCFDDTQNVRSQARFIVPRPAYGDWVVFGNKLSSSGTQIAFVTVD